MDDYKKNFIVIVLMLFVLSSYNNVVAGESNEYKIKAEYLVNFARFIYWPKSVVETTDYFNICVLGHDHFGALFEKLSVNKVINKNIKLKTGKKYNNINNCQIIYFDRSEKNRYRAFVRKLVGKTILTVSDIEGFSTTGGMIEFVQLGDRIGFEINVEQSIKSNIRYRTQLLLVAEKIK